MHERRAILDRYLPVNAGDLVLQLQDEWKFQLKITKNRTTKVGDYRSPRNGGPHRITVNHDLNPFAFLITLIHEIAHLVVFEDYGRSVDPHGREWRQKYRELLNPFLEQGIFPEDIKASVMHYFDRDVNRTDLEINAVLRKYDMPNGLIPISELPDETMFKLNDGRLFIRGNRIRTRYRCLCLTNRKTYLIPKLMEVYPVHYQYKLEFSADL
jgi:SprT protein